MKISSISGLVYRVQDLAKTIEFYQTLGFRLGKSEERQVTCYVNWFWVTFTLDGEADAGSGPTLHMKVDDIDDFYGGVLANGLLAETEPRKQRGGNREFLMLDPDGNKLVFFAK